MSALNSVSQVSLCGWAWAMVPVCSRQQCHSLLCGSAVVYNYSPVCDYEGDAICHNHVIAIILCVCEYRCKWAELLLCGPDRLLCKCVNLQLFWTLLSFNIIVLIDFQPSQCANVSVGSSIKIFYFLIPLAILMFHHHLVICLTLIRLSTFSSVYLSLLLSFP